LLEPISITAIHSISSLGHTANEIWENYNNNIPFIKEKNNFLIAELPNVLYAIYTARKAINKVNWKGSDFGINIGSSRGATKKFESHHETFLKRNKANPLSSPTTTLGNISSWVAHDLQTKGPEISHSITCSTALHALLNGIAWLQAGMADTFLVGGSEAPLTSFTLAQMQALKIYANENNQFPCLALDLNKKKNTMVLGEGAAMACLEKGSKANALAKVVGIGYATEVLEHNVSLSTNADCFQRSMQMALNNIDLKEVDVIVTHAPGTIKGDMAEINAIEKVFKNKIPALANNKWKLGHTFGASGMLNIEMALLMLEHQTFIPVPYITPSIPKKIKTILVNAVGFGGNAVSILLTK